jgi:hypothetical protein
VKFGVDFSDVDVKGGLLSQEPSWQTAFKPGELAGGPSPMGNSKWAEFVRCPRRYYYQHVKRLTTVELFPWLELGGLVHEAIAQALLAWPDGDEAFWDSLWYVIDRASTVAPVTANEARRLLTAWAKFWGPKGVLKITANDILHVELALEVKKPFHYSTRIDAVIKVQGQPTICEHKTAGRRSTVLLDSYKLNPQFIGQVWLWKKCDLGDLRAFMVDQIVKHEREVMIYQEEVVIPDEMLKAWEKSMKKTSWELEECAHFNKWPQRMHNCAMWNRSCEYMGMCLYESMDGLRKKEKGEF